MLKVHSEHLKLAPLIFEQALFNPNLVVSWDLMKFDNQGGGFLSALITSRCTNPPTSPAMRRHRVSLPGEMSNRHSAWKQTNK